MNDIRHCVTRLEAGYYLEVHLEAEDEAVEYDQVKNVSEAESTEAGEW